MKTIIGIGFVIWLACSQGLAADLASAPTNLFQAIRAGDSAKLRTLLEGGADVEARDPSGNTPLLVAAWSADAAVLELLLKAGAAVNATNQAGATALMRAATFEDKARLLITRGADVKARSRLGNTALILAARKPGNSGVVKLLLDRGAAPEAGNVFGATPLMAAAAAEDVDSVRLLLDRGAPVDAKPNMDVNGFIWGGGRTALMWAAFHGNETLLQLLLERGAKVNEFTLAGGALAQAAWGGHPGAARRLLETGAPIDQRDLIANYTPLHWAASSEHASSKLVELLLARGADVNAEGGQPVDNFLGATQTPLDLARKRGDTAIARALRQFGAKEASASFPVRGEKALAQGNGPSGSKTVVEAIQRALPPLQKTASESVSTYLRHASKQDCISCHQQQLPLAAISLAHSRQFATDRAATERQLELLRRDIAVGHIIGGGENHTIVEMELQTTFHPEPSIFGGYVSLAFQLEHQPASEATDALVHQLATIQHPDGHWSWNLPRPPIQASDIGATALAIHSVKTFAIPARRAELESRLRQARAWLANARAESTEERIHQVLGLAWAGEEPALLQTLSQRLIREQRSDGGWGQLAGLDSDAYATGQALYALMEGGRISHGDPAVRRGLDFLLRTQLPDGTWHVRRRAHPFQPPMESGFPHGADGWISSAGTSWAVMALATTLDPKETPATGPWLATTGRIPSKAAAPAVGPTATPVEFARDIQPLLERSCVACHSGERAKGGFVVTDRAALLQGGKRGEPVLVPGKPDASPLLHFVQDQVADMEMPPLGKRGKFPALTQDEIGRLSGWIAQGATWPAGATLHGPNQ